MSEPVKVTEADPEEAALIAELAHVVTASEPVKIIEGPFWSIGLKTGHTVLVQAASFNEALGKLAAGPPVESEIEKCDLHSWIKRVIA